MNKVKKVRRLEIWSSYFVHLQHIASHARLRVARIPMQRVDEAARLILIG